PRAIFARGAPKESNAVQGTEVLFRSHRLPNRAIPYNTRGGWEWMRSMMQSPGQPMIFLHQPTMSATAVSVPVVLPAVPPPRAVSRRMPEIVDEGVRAVRRDIGLYTAVAAFTVIPARLVTAGVSTLFTPFNPLDPFTYYRVGAHAAITTSPFTTF